MEEINNILKNEAVSKDDKERAVLEVANFLIKEGRFDPQNVKQNINIEQNMNLLTFSQNLRSLWPDLTAARASKILKKITDLLPNSNYKDALPYVNEMIQWSDQKYLKLFYETKKVAMLYELREFTQCLKNIKILHGDLKKMNDKLNLINLYIYESKTYFELENMTRAKASLTSARALAVTTFCPFYIQSQIELLAGMYSCEEGNYFISYNHYIEALDGFNQYKMVNECILTLRYIILSYIILNKWGDLKNILSKKITQPYVNDKIVKILLLLAESVKNKDLSTFDKEIQENLDILNDTFILSHLTYLKDILLDANILKLIEPYLNVSITFLAEKLNFPVAAIEAKLRTLILDKKISGILDYYTNTLVLYEKVEMTETENNQLETMKMIVRSIKAGTSE
ncbi:26S proteasome regulatory complex, subunit RPN6/PSMD11 [Pseudoloma neurophilia]|uniref:26S proteasome regulatory complex, subunit RPN6/PSMD11 n=1 Tax=Pseudoloma neurophilia TaxID=146866 RepID=A0A0R0LVW3_9MICR|nr:26S proteasome regulatory complex, subunit RPN6/PSMD11 [Pseudoloma neurophilia]